MKGQKYAKVKDGAKVQLWFGLLGYLTLSEKLQNKLFLSCTHDKMMAQKDCSLQCFVFSLEMNLTMANQVHFTILP